MRRRHSRHTSDTVSHVTPGALRAELTLPVLCRRREMSTHDSASLEETAPSSLSALAEQLRDGPLQELLELQAKATELADRLADSPEDRLEDLERLVRLSLSAMEQFHSFTREFTAVLREITDARRHSH